VHTVRKEIKKMRAILRLARGGLKGGEYRKTVKLIRLAAKPLAVPRDARVMEKALEMIEGRQTRQFPNILSALKTYCNQSERNFKSDDSASVSQYTLQEACDRVNDLDAKDAGWREVRACLKRGYQRGREAWLQAKLHPSPEHLHEWRKRIKALWYQLDFLCRDWPPKTKGWMDDLEKLGDQLGNDHDLVLLEKFALEHCEQGLETKELQRLIDSRRQEHLREVRRLGARLYVLAPKAACGQWEQDWKSWRKGG